MKIVAIKEMSAGNESVGEMWKEAKVFEETATLKEVMEFAEHRKKKNITLVILEGEASDV